MPTYARYYKDDTGAVEFTNYVDLPTAECVHTITPYIEVIPGSGGSNTYITGGTRYTQKWVITAVVDRQSQDFLRGCATDTFDANTTLRVYDEYTAPNYTDYSAVKIVNYQSRTTDGGSKYTVSLTVVK